MGGKLLLVDGFSILFRAYYALPLFTNNAGEYTNAVYGFLNIFLRFVDEEKPEYIAVAFDTPKPTFRHERYEAYKGTRSAAPNEFIPQVPLLKNVLAAMKVHIVECPGYEADDVLGTLAVAAEAHGILPVIISGDRDLLQLAGDTVKIRIPKTRGGKTEVEDYLAADVLAKIGVSPKEYIDVKALMGDTSDNIPGVPGIGEVTAVKIIAAYGSVENAIAHAADIRPKKACENLLQYREQALLSKELATIKLDAPAVWDETAARTGDMWNDDTYALFTRLEFKSLMKYFTPQPKADAAPVQDIKIINTETEAEIFFTRLGKKTCAAFHTLTDGDMLLGIGFALENDPPAYLSVCEALSESVLLTLAAPWLASPAPKTVLDSKHEGLTLYRRGIRLNNAAFDVMLASYVLDAAKPALNARDAAEGYLRETMPLLEDLLENKGKRGKDRKTASDLSLETRAGYAAKAADILRRVQPIMDGQLRGNGQWSLFEDIELPLAHVLADMERFGIRVDADALIEYGHTLDTHITTLTKGIYELAGEQFNIQSPSQLGVILFERLGLKGTKKTTQGWSTAADILEKMAHKHPIVPLVLEYRTYAKLKSTYADGLLPLIQPGTSRIHSTFHQALTLTGRLSSAEPNLQNIPVRMPLGRELRKAFTAPDADTVFVDADYSQIELRILAHMSGDETLINAFLNEWDIHRITASQVFHVPLEAVTPTQRSNAKAVNFGIVYGISAFGLSEDLGITKKEAETYISGYFETYPRVKKYLDETVAQAKKDGYVSTLYNRRRAIPELTASNFNLRSFGERVAMNMPIQGTAADIIKIAMINVSRRFAREKLSSRLILQVHDELLLEVKKSELEAVQTLLKEEMESAAQLKVPLVADVHAGNTWYDAK